MDTEVLRTALESVERLTGTIKRAVLHLPPEPADRVTKLRSGEESAAPIADLCTPACLDLPLDACHRLPGDMPDPIVGISDIVAALDRLSRYINGIASYLRTHDGPARGA